VAEDELQANEGIDCVAAVMRMLVGGLDFETEAVMDWGIAGTEDSAVDEALGVASESDESDIVGGAIRGLYLMIKT